MWNIESVSQSPARLAALKRHADHVLGDAERDISTPADLADPRARYSRFVLMRENGPLAHVVP